MLNIKTAFGLTAAIVFATTVLTSAGETKTFRATGNFIRINDSMLLLRTSAQDIEFLRDAKTKINGKLTNGAFATVMYDKVAGQPHATEVTITASTTGGAVMRP